MMGGSGPPTNRENGLVMITIIAIRVLLVVSLGVQAPAYLIVLQLELPE